MANTPNQNNPPHWHRDAFTVFERNGRFGVRGPHAGTLIGWFKTREIAEKIAERTRRQAIAAENRGRGYGPPPGTVGDEPDEVVARPGQSVESAAFGQPAPEGYTPRDTGAQTPYEPPAAVTPPPPPPPPPPAVFSAPAPPPPAPMGVPAGYRYIPAHVRRVSRDVDDIGEPARAQFRGFPGGSSSSPLGPNVVSAFASAMAQALGRAAASTAQPAGHPPAPPTPIPASQPPAPLPVPTGPGAVPLGSFPASMIQHAQRGGVPATTTGPVLTPYTPLSAFPTSMLQAAGKVPYPAPPPPPPKPTAWQVFQQNFHKALGPAVAMSGFPGIGRAAMAGAVAAIPGVGEVALFAGAVVKATEQLRRFAESTLAVNRGLAAFSPGLMRGMFQLNLHDYQRQIDLAQRTEKSGSDLIKAVDAMRSSLQEYRVAALNLQNFGAGAAAGFLEGAGRSFDWIPAGVNALFGDPNGQNGGRNLGNFAWDVIEKSTAFGYLNTMMKWLQDKGLWPKAQQGPQDLRGPMDKFALGMAMGQFGGPLLARPRRPHMQRGM